MKLAIFGLLFFSLSAPAHAQLGGLLKKAQQARDAKQKFDDLNITDEEELTLGQAVSDKVRARFGVVQNANVHKYVTLVGTLVAQGTERPTLPWTFIVLDTDGVNAFASPGGFVHVTRGALGLIKNEAELAAVLGHEIGHVARKHTVNAIKKSKSVGLASSETLSSRSAFLDKLADRAYEMVLENSFDRGDELDADKLSVTVTQKVGYAPAALGDFLARLAERNKDMALRNGLFASHPELKERIDKIKELAGSKPGATVEARYHANIKYEAAPITKIAVVEEGAAGLAGSTKEDGKEKEKKPEEPKKRGFGLGALKQTVAPEQQSAQVSASGGARGVGPDRAAKGGSNPNPVKVAVSAAELETFKKGIA